MFVRRVYLDVIGTLPTAQEAQRVPRWTGTRTSAARLIDRLLEREEFADYWAMKWSDLLRVKAEFPINLWPNAAQAYHRWIRDLPSRRTCPTTGSCASCSRPAAATSACRQVNFYRAMQSREPQGIAQAVALTFMGTRAEKWPKERLAGMAAFFSQVGYKSTARMEGGDRLLRSRQGDGNGRRRRPRPSSPMARRPGCRRTRIRARSSPTG